MLFRKRRRSFFLPGKRRQYLAYAIGEVLLIVIGILLALAIDNNSQQQALRKKEQVYLVGLKEEFQISADKLAELIRVNRESLEGAKIIAQYISGGLPLPGEADFSELLYRTLAYDIAFNPNNALLNEMINSGSLKDISNPRLKVYFTTWVAALDDIAQQEAQLAEQRAEALELFRKGDYSIRTIFDQTGISASQFDLPPREPVISNLPLLKDPAFENKVLLLMAVSYATERNHYLPLQKNLVAILQLIEEEIA
ncbi:MAG TPA: hypothetical protein VJ953_07365 [Saprospiraceae bacterium]|nr:hypothetical protein [Saprospiraceae bacterium]